MNKTALALIAGLVLISVMASSYAYADWSFGVRVYPRYGTYFCGYDAWGYPQYCSYGYGYPYPYRYRYPYGYAYPYWRHHHRHW